MPYDRAKNINMFSTLMSLRGLLQMTRFYFTDFYTSLQLDQTVLSWSMCSWPMLFTVQFLAVFCSRTTAQRS